MTNTRTIPPTLPQRRFVSFFITPFISGELDTDDIWKGSLVAYVLDFCEAMIKEELDSFQEAQARFQRS